MQTVWVEVTTNRSYLGLLQPAWAQAERVYAFQRKLPPVGRQAGKPASVQLSTLIWVPVSALGFLA